MYRINQFKIYIDELSDPNPSGRVNDEETDLLYKGVSSVLGISRGNINLIKIRRKSVDARKGKRTAYIYTLDVDTDISIRGLDKINRRLKKQNISIGLITDDAEEFEPVIMDAEKTAGIYNSPKANNSDFSPVIIGAGPAGLFCGYILALNGLKPIIIEQGSSIERRVAVVNSYWNNESELNPYCNVSFGEGGAGTFSDGKLNTSVKDTSGRIDYVKKVFILHGAPEEIGYLAKPHIGTDELRKVITNIREDIINLGGKVIFDTCMTDITVDNGRIAGIDVLHTEDSSTEHISCNTLVLAIGHSARDTYSMLRGRVHMEQKDFAIGVRVEHPQDFISYTQYGELYKMLPPADYRLRYHASNGRSVYSFCMCPGGHVVNASSEKGAVVTNGMSNYSRNSGFANSAIVVNVTKDDFDGTDVLAGVEFQREWERKACKIADGCVPVMTFGEFAGCEGGEGFHMADTSGFMGECRHADIRKALPDYVTSAITEAMRHFDKQIKGYGTDDVVMYGVETRTSAPVRIVRNEEGQSDITGIYPCGEGAGYAGGIMSAAVDGIKIAHKIVNNLFL